MESIIEKCGFDPAVLPGLESGIYRLIPLTRGLHALVDAARYDELVAVKWFAMRISATFYAARCSNRRTIYMHSTLAGKGVDHRNRHGLDNRLANLRLASGQQQKWNRRKPSHNSTGFIGVDLNLGKWRAVASDANGKQKCIGRFKTALEAALAYDEFIAYRGEFANYNLDDALRGEAV